MLSMRHWADMPANAARPASRVQVDLSGGGVWRAAQSAAKELIFAVAGQPLTDALIADTTRRIARQRASADGREGVAAFLEKRPPVWGA